MHPLKWRNVTEKIIVVTGSGGGGFAQISGCNISRTAKAGNLKFSHVSQKCTGQVYENVGLWWNRGVSRTK